MKREWMPALALVLALAGCVDQPVTPAAETFEPGEFTYTFDAPEGSSGFFEDIVFPDGAHAYELKAFIERPTVQVAASDSIEMRHLASERGGFCSGSSIVSPPSNSSHCELGASGGIAGAWTLSVKATGPATIHVVIRYE